MLFTKSVWLRVVWKCYSHYLMQMITYFIYEFSSLIIDLSSHTPMAADYFVQNICDSWCRLFNDSFFFRASRQTINAKNPVSTSINFLKITKDDSACYITSFATVILCKSGIFLLSIFFFAVFPCFWHGSQVLIKIIYLNIF